MSQGLLKPKIQIKIQLEDLLAFYFFALHN